MPGLPQTSAPIGVPVGETGPHGCASGDQQNPLERSEGNVEQGSGTQHGNDAAAEHGVHRTFDGFAGALETRRPGLRLPQLPGPEPDRLHQFVADGGRGLSVTSRWPTASASIRG